MFYLILFKLWILLWNVVQFTGNYFQLALDIKAVIWLYPVWMNGGWSSITEKKKVTYGLWAWTSYKRIGISLPRVSCWILRETMHSWLSCFQSSNAWWPCRLMPIVVLILIHSFASNILTVVTTPLQSVEKGRCRKCIRRRWVTVYSWDIVVSQVTSRYPGLLFTWYVAKVSHVSDEVGTAAKFSNDLWTVSL